ncbi:winged helix DNA-binding domain-containing protein [Flavobacterium inviolabile]|uniref:winged helix DNA-binding domain-containing protein n=1 Tax=Flavobacterium inviolabile TaxID=2748320 RepID=UPI0015AF0263|nr:winged helix DNA-binding domain-containing protein [Flavobacterium inviolabile]
MTLTDIANIRLANQLLIRNKAGSISEIATYMGALQAQDYAMSKWALGIRHANATESLVEAAMDNGEIIRTHVMRPTWHTVAASDIYWILELSANRIKSSMTSGLKELELDQTVLSRCYSVMEKALRDHNHLTREELVSELEKHNIATNDSRSSYILMHAELSGILGSGKTKNKKSTYAFLPEWVPQKNILPREEALAKLARKYFTSHGPATILDFHWWCGLSLTETKKALELVQSDFISETIGTETYWFSPALVFPEKENNSVQLLPAFDEFLISYKDRTATLTMDHHKKAITRNGIFHPVIVSNGKAVGIWKRSLKKNAVTIDIHPFEPFSADFKKIIEHEIGKLGTFLDKAPETIYHS